MENSTKSTMLTAERRPAKTFRDLVVWQKAHALTLAMYRYSAGFPKQETYAIAAQMRRAAVSIPATSRKDFENAGARIRPGS